MEGEKGKMSNKNTINEWRRVIEDGNSAVIKPKRTNLGTLKTLTEEEIKQLESASDIMWKAMNSLIKKSGYSDLTLYLEGSSYELRNIVKRLRDE